MFFGAPKVTTTLLVDISSSSVGAAYLSSKKGDAPVMVHAVRTSIRESGDGRAGMLRALDSSLRTLQEKGGPKRHSLIGGMHAHKALVCVGAPWQESDIATKVIEKDKPFTFTKGMLEEALKEKDGRSLLIASLLNGYETADPIGKRVKRADMVVLSSHIPEELYTVIRKTVRGFVGTDAVRFVSFGEAAKGILDAVFPNDPDYLALRVSEDATEAALVRRGVLSAVRSASCGTRTFVLAARHSGTNPLSAADDVIDRDKSARMAERLLRAQEEWVGKMRECLNELAHKTALPRSLYLFSEPNSAKFVARLFDVPELHALWLSDEPLEIVEMNSARFDAFLHRTSEEADAFLDALSLVGPK